MKQVRFLAIPLLAVLIVVALLLPLSAMAAASAHTSTSYTTSASTSPFKAIPVTGTVKNKAGNTIGTFSGTLDVSKFAAQSGHLVAKGKLSGTLKNTSGVVIATITNKAVTIPVSFAAPPTCTILTLVLGPIHLNVLGLVIDVSQITVTITAQAGTLLGGLLCQLAGATTLQQIVSLLNQILALLGV